MIKTCAKCGGEFIPQKITSKYCSRDCYLAANKERAAENWKHQHAKSKIQYSPSENDFDLKPGDIVYGPDRQLDGEKNRGHKFKVLKIYSTSSRLNDWTKAGNEASRRPTISAAKSERRASMYSRVYTDRPDYADFDAPQKFNAIMSIIARRLTEHPNAICSYSGGADSDIMIDLIERTREIFNLPPVKYVFFNTGLEMKATKDHVKEVGKKYGVEIEEHRPKISIVQSARIHGIPFVSKIMSAGLSEWQKKGIPLSIAEEYENAEDKENKRKELKKRFPKCESVINFLCCCNSKGEPRPDIQLVINSSKYMRDFIAEFPPEFKISAKCCDYCKKTGRAQRPKGIRHDYHRRAKRRRRNAIGSEKRLYDNVLHGKR